MKKTYGRVVLAALCLLAGAARDGAASGIQRFALIAGADYGGGARQRLKYASRDAQRFGRVLRELGGLSAANTVILEQPSLRQLQQALDDLGRKVAAVPAEQDGTRPRTEMVVYYSGHADGAGLLLGDDRFSYRTLRAALDGVGADVRIAVLDACASGAITRLKGGQERPAFLVDASMRMEGHAFLTSSAADEVAQESDRIGASYFTHFLISGLRGAADVSGEGTVTLDEAYRFAFRETLGRTAGTRAGAQHPSYDISLKGAGDVVMTDLRSTSAGLVLAEDLAGRCYVRDADERLVVELQKLRDRRIELGLPPGRYELRCQDETHAVTAHPVLAEGTRTVLAASDFAPARREVAVTRGDAEIRGTFPAPGQLEASVARDTLQVGSLSLVYSWSFRPRVSLGLRLERRGHTSTTRVPTGLDRFATTSSAALAQLRLDLRAPGTAAGVRPYLFAGAGPQRQVDTSERFLGPQVEGWPASKLVQHFVGYTAELGTGLDTSLVGGLTLGLRLGYRYHVMHGGLRGQNEIEYGAMLGWRFGERNPRP